ncbi:c-type cytochrome biogenesis protein CcmI [Brenneria corticis]|uniref:C-type cytochrome biogenesis protein CcmI n=1 Tax=Brenneria corticis TaxID=2173106 RepID=A0A2U1U475_9GAMM|nr:c-type cytochrome biogenesis protein CcmI [Brenneria sp. CFCC 11842]PWC16460.1 c-type cytochrome biogenesis protein CcmI [Brenneria sp. CFCC 11842]
MILLTTTIILSLAAVTALLLAPWSTRDACDRDAINRALYRHRLRELAADAASDAERAGMVEELQQTLLQDIPGKPAAQRRPVSRWALLPGIMLLAAISLGLFWKTASVNRVQEWRQVVRQTPALMQRVMDPQTESLTLEELARLGLGLRSRLETRPDDPQEWWLLGRIAGVLDNAAMAVQAFGQAYQRDPHNAELKLDYAELLLRSANPRESQRGEAMLRELLHSDTVSVRALSLLAFHAYEGQRYREAIDAWQTMLRLLPLNDTRRAVIERSIIQAKEGLASGASAGR